MTFVIIKDHLANFEIAPGQFALPGDVIELDERETQMQVEAGNVALVNDNDLDNFIDKVKEPDSLLIKKDNEIAELRKQIIEQNNDTKVALENKVLKEEVKNLQANAVDLEAQLKEVNEKLNLINENYDIPELKDEKPKELVASAKGKGGKKDG